VPNLVVWGNPPVRVPRTVRMALSRSARVVGKIAANVHEISYEHAEDGKPYKHPFEDDAPAEMWAVELENGQRNILITGRDGQPLWDDF